MVVVEAFLDWMSNVFCSMLMIGTLAIVVPREIQKKYGVGHRLEAFGVLGFPALREAPALPQASSIPVGEMLFFPVCQSERSAYSCMTPSPFTCLSPVTWFLL